MTFEQHPAPGSGPLSVDPGTPSALIEFADRSAVDPVTGRNVMFLRAVQVSDQATDNLPRPALLLAVGQGPPTEVTASPTSIPRQTGGSAAATAVLTAEGDGIDLIEIEPLESDLQWQLQIINRDTRSRRYTWVVATTDAETRQPWLDIASQSVAFDTLTGETPAAQEVTLANYGTGPLVLDDPDGAELGAGFRVLTITPRPLGGNRRALARIGFTAPDTPGAPATTHTFGSNDPAAANTAGHNNRLGLTATVRLGAHLTVTRSPEGAHPVVGTQFKIARELTTIGRNPDNHIVLDHPKVDPRHAEIRRDGESLTLVDLGSENGTGVSGDPVIEATLQDGDRVQINIFSPPGVFLLMFSTEP